jgi:predicted dehydrogenase
MIQVGILGAGFMGTTHARAYAKLPQVKVAVVADTVREKAERLAEEVGSRVETNLEALFADPSLSVIDITSPTPFHAEYAIRAMESGKHVLVEKPLALSVEEADAILAAAQRTGRFLMVAHVLRFWPEYVVIHELLQNGKLGKPVSATAYRLSNTPQWSAWFQDPKLSGGTILDLAVHDIDMMNWLFGVPQTVFASGAGVRDGDWGHVLVQGDHAGIKTSIEASFIMPKDLPFAAGIRILCEKGMVEYKFQAGGASLEQGLPVNSFLLHEPERPNQIISVRPANAYEAEIAYFVHCLENNTPPLTASGQAGRDAVYVAISARRSMESSLPVEIR